MSHPTINKVATGFDQTSREPSVRTAGGVAIAALRVSLGFVFLWAFLDKTFGLGYSTPSAKSWISGGSPTEGAATGSTNPFMDYHLIYACP
jgi:thiosulfate dehydrogenase (quinone) large subunit